MNRLRKFAASIGVIFVAFTPLLFSTPAYAQTLEEAQSALAAGQQEVIDATRNKQSADELVSSKTTSLQIAQLALTKAQIEYETILISDPTGLHQTQEVEHVRMVDKREMV